MTKLKLILATAMLCAGLGTVSVSAMPISDLSNVVPANVERTRLVCNPYRCWVRQDYYGYYGYRYRGYRGWRGYR
jgi:hypothetical protein